MSFFTDWLTNIIVLILLATIVEMMLPNSEMRRYVKMTVGILLLFLILKPLLSIFTVDVEQTFSHLVTEAVQSDYKTEKLINLQKTEIENGQRAYISEQIAVQLKEEMKEVLQTEHALTITSVEVELNEKGRDISDLEIKTVSVHVKPHEVEEDDERVIQIEEVKIDTSQQRPLELYKESTNELEKIRTLLSEKWQLPEEAILLTWEGGKRAR